MSTARHHIARRRFLVFGGLGLTLIGLIYLPLTLLAPLEPAEVAVSQPGKPPAEPAELNFPSYGASAIGAVGFPGVLATSGASTPQPMASITKVITALVVLDAHPLAPEEQGPTVTMSSTDVAQYGRYQAQNGSVTAVRAGMSFTQRQLLELTLVKSANNYTMSTVLWAFGSETTYLEAARAWLIARGLDQITLVEPTGIDPANVAPVDQLVDLGRMALEHPVIADIVATANTTIPGLGALPNTNALLGVDGVDGIKTGTLDGFGANLLFSADYTVGDFELTLIGVVLGGPTHEVIDADIRLLLSSTLNNFSQVEVVSAGEHLASYSTEWGDSSEAVTTDAITLLRWADTPIETRIITEEFRTADAGEDVGDVIVTSGPHRVQIDLELAQDVHDPGPWWRLTNPGLLL